ncbi:MAG: hypothetical protein U0941_17875 [Planctomycetaceae bacterium]
MEYWKNFEFNRYRELMRSLDYYLYLGNDEGSMGFLDAVSAGIPTIVTPQGFHLDVPNGITHPFHTLDDLVSVFKKIDTDRRERSNLVSSWTWENYARAHLRAWVKLLEDPNTMTRRTEDTDVVRRVREINQRNTEKLCSRLARIMFREGPLRVGCRAIRRWIESAG